jgi:glycosyltransferase involved in cell wall biosynthesis
VKVDSRSTRRANPTLWYLSCESPTEGQASHAHIMGIVRGLESLGWRTRLWHPAARRGSRGALRRIVDITAVQLRLIARRDRPDILYVRDHFLSLPAVLWARIRRVPVVFEVNGPGDDVLSSWPQLRPIIGLIQLSGKVQLRLSAAAIAVTPALAEIATVQGAPRSYVVSNGADTDRFSPRADTSVNLPKRFVSFVGTLATWQGIDTLLDALDRPAWPKDVSLVVVGDGVLMDSVRERAAREPRLRYLGRIPHEEVGGVIARSICALSPKASPSLLLTGVVPLKLFEAMACGVAVIVTDVPGQADIIRQAESGIVVPPSDPDAIATAVASLASHPSVARAMGERGRRAAVDRYSWSASAAKTDTIIRRLLP